LGLIWALLLLETSSGSKKGKEEVTRLMDLERLGGLLECGVGVCPDCVRCHHEFDIFKVERRASSMEIIYILGFISPVISIFA
jgi:hypothetical protein